MRRKKNESFEIIDNYVKKESEENHDEYSILSSSLSNLSLDNKEYNLGFWNNIYKNLSDFKNKIKFNIIATGVKVDFEEIEYINLYNNKYFINNDYNVLISHMNEIFWFSYKTNFEPILYNNKIYMSDAGWGCMIRCGQMILAKGLYNISNKSNKEYNFNNILALFSDDQIKLKKIINNQFFDYFKNGSIETVNDKDLRRHTGEFEYISNEVKVDYITTPFSIRNICNSSIELSKGAGDWFSNYDIIKILKKLNSRYKPLKDMKILDFYDGTIYLSDILKECFSEKVCLCSHNRVSYQYDKINDFSVRYKTHDDFVIIDNHNLINECKCFENCFFNENKNYELKEKFIMFVSNRIGLDVVEEEYYPCLISFFKIYNNLGIIGGKGSKALYFIGTYEKSLIFIDPHYVQDNKKTAKFKPEEIFYLGLEDMTPCFTMGFYCTDIKEFKILISELEKIKSEYRIINYKKRRNLYN